MAEPPPDQPSQPALDLDLDQLRKRAAPAFDDASEAVLLAVRNAYGTLDALGGWPAGEEADKAFVEWYKPKRDEMRHWITEFAKVYADIADGLLTMRHNVKEVDWGIADDIKLSDVPVYEWPKDDRPW
ncbi:hypothetical protein HTZ77_18330 [Nonomuraea sp. SMC257]|uniref:Uncharacterized protein n=1 Tax=Nonomuraea montanisoli TaxID=2741721 RepID=A0A7Y6I892_9ACTN|nr:hypothetical protein [Nonomuraea montanisoli]NUW33371.1 hypothetical protein [Nonomuraea montanisoli]